MSTENNEIEQGASAGVDRGDEVKTLAEAAPPVDAAAAPEVEVEVEDKEEKKGGKMIPLDRHKDILDRQRARVESLERELSQQRQTGQQAEFNEDIAQRETAIQALEKKMHDQLLAGENEKAAETMTKIRHAEREVSDMKTEVRMQVAESRAIERARFDIVLERLEEAYPELNPEHEAFDENVVAEVLELQTGFIRTGKSPSEALQKAVKYVLGKPETRAQQTAVDVTPRVNKDDVAAQRKAEAAKKAAETIGKTPPNTKNVGLDSDKMGGGPGNMDTSKLSYDEFSKLPDEVIRKMRGDVVV